jgi:hypothetical protein
MAKWQPSAGIQRDYTGKALIALGLVGVVADLWFLAKPFAILAARLQEGFLGLVPAMGMYILNAAHAVAFHQVDPLWLASRILVLSCAVASLILGAFLLRRKPKQLLIIDLALTPEFEGRETINNGSR